MRWGGTERYWPAGVDPKLKACVYCDSSEVAVDSVLMEWSSFCAGSADVYYGFCRSCGSQGPEARTEIGAKRRWNRRL